MFKVILLIALSVAGVCAQEAAPEPFNYAYDGGSGQTAAEQRDASGKVTGYYTIADADGRQRRVDYVADEAGFRAKVQTNEVGTKSENSADVEVLAYPPTQEQYTVAAESTGVQRQAYTVQPQRFVSTQQVVAAAPPKVASTVQYVQQPQYGYYSSYPGSYYGSNQYGSNQYGYAVAGGVPSYGTGNTGVYGGYQTVSSVPATSSYYRQSIQPATSYYRQTVQPATVSQVPVGVSSGSYRYQAVGAPSSLAYHSGVVPATYSSVGPVTTGYTYKSVSVPTSGVSYQTSGVVPTQTVGSPTGNLLGSSNYLVLQKRDSDKAAKQDKA